MNVRVTVTAAIVALLCATIQGGEAPTGAYLFTMAPRYQPAAEGKGAPRFPQGASIMLATGGGKQALAPSLNASADPAVSFDGQSILFSGRTTAGDPWQIWEVAAAGGTPRQITHCPSDCTHPLFLPDGRIVYTRSSTEGSEVDIAERDGARPQRLTFAPGHPITQDVLRDSRILFESDGELFTVYPDGTGVEALRCDHGPRRSGARQIASGDVVFGVDGRLARFTSALAVQTDVAQFAGKVAGPIAEISPGKWLVSLRKGRQPFGLYVWSEDGRLEPLQTPAVSNVLQPVLLRAHAPGKQFPSALVESRTNGNLLCLNARDSKEPLAGQSSAVQVYTRDSAGNSMLLGRQTLANDGSFYVELPADRPLRIELVNDAGGVVRAERGWFWMRPSEQRICVGCHTGPERSPENKVPEVLLRSIVPEKLLGGTK